MIQIPNLNITCGTPDCENGHHAFNSPGHIYKKRGKDRKYLQPGVCKACGADVVDWPRIHARNPQDIAKTFSMLQLEYIRWEFWNRPFNDKSLTSAQKRGWEGLCADSHAAIAKVLGPVAYASWAFKQVPTKPEKMTSVIEYAQHAVAACCRKCVAQWHGIPNEMPLADGEIDYLSRLVIGCLERRLPQIVLEAH